MSNPILLVLLSLFFSNMSLAVTVVGLGSTFEINIGEGFNGEEGDEREAVFVAAAKFWADKLVSPVVIEIDAEFISTLTCNPNSATLGSASPSISFLSRNRANEIGLQSGVRYPSALINAYNGSDFFINNADISARFNDRLGDSDCLSRRSWYYGLDGNAASNQIDFFDIVRHELGHGLGILSLVNDDGTDQSGVDIFTTFLHDQSTGKDWTEMTDAERNISVTNNGNVVWNGNEVNELAGNLTAGVNSGKVRIYAPNSYISGSSISHFDTALSPNELMEPSYNSNSTYDHSIALLKDIGWSIVADNNVAVNDIPVITGQSVLSTNEDTSISLLLTHLTVTDSDNNFPADFSLTVSSGSNYSVSNQTITPNSNYVGTLTVPVTVNDGKDTSNSFNLTISVNAINDSPVISGASETSVLEGGNYSFIPSVSDVDVGDTTTFSIVNKPSWATFNTLTGALTGTPDNGDVGTYTKIIITVIDSEGASDSLAAFTIEVIGVSTNQAPVTSNQTSVVDEDNTVTITLDVTDPDDDELTYTIISQPLHGTLVQVNNNNWNYSPNENFNGNDSFIYRVMDKELSSPNTTVNITVNSVNDSPIAEDDFITLAYSESGRYVLDVLNNDSDVDGDSLNIIAVSSVVAGTLSINADQLIYEVNELVTGDIQLTYTISDGDNQSENSTATVIIRFDGNADVLLPVISLPDDIEVNATGLFTKIDLGFATAINNKGEPIAVKLVDNTTQFLPGSYMINWQAIDTNGLQQIASQRVDVHPLISISQDRQGVEGNEYKIAVNLNGESPIYPLIIPFSVSGSADGSDHDLTSGEVFIESGIVGYIEFTTFTDNIVEVNESITITLENTVNLGFNSEFTMLLTEDNVAPKVSVTVSQNNLQRNVIDKTLGNVVISSDVFDDNTNDNHAFEWKVIGTEFANVDDSNANFIFNPESLTTGQHLITLTVTDDGDEPLSAQAYAYIDIVETLPTLTNEDQDGDSIADNIEGYGDSDGDGIVDYLDNFDSCNIQPQIVGDFTQFYIEAEPGYCLFKGINTINNASGALLLNNSEVAEDDVAVNIGGIFDFVVSGIPIAGSSISIVIPQRLPIPDNAVYRKVNSDDVWSNFVVDEKNYYSSAAGEMGFCPPPNSDSWSVGLTEGHWCVQLTIEDGGNNDGDNLINNQIIDPGGVAIIINNNTLPVAQNDNVTTAQNTAITINVLTNDSDADGDTLRLLTANVDFGNVTIVDQQLLYQPSINFSGVATINYTISDGSNGTGQADVFVTVNESVVANTTPTIIDDALNTNDTTVVTIDVLANDSDVDNDELTLTQASAEQGSVVINNNRLVYTPLVGFEGIDTIIYRVSDSNGGESQGEVIITLTVSETVTPEAASAPESSGGTVELFLLFLILVMLFTRNKRKLIGINKLSR